MSEQNTELLNKLLVNGIQEAKKVYIQHATLTEAVAQNTLNEIDEKAKHTATKVFEMTAVAEDEPSYPLYVKQFHVLCALPSCLVLRYRSSSRHHTKIHHSNFVPLSLNC
jgi:hypothetical protein